MATVKKKIGRVPVYRGVYQVGKSYSMHNIVSYMNSSFVSERDGNTNPPCVEENGNLILSDGWQFLADSSYAYKLVDNMEEDISEAEFNRLKEEGKLDPNKRYYIYEE